MIQGPLKAYLDEFAYFASLDSILSIAITGHQIQLRDFLKQLNLIKFHSLALAILSLHFFLTLSDVIK